MFRVFFEVFVIKEINYRVYCGVCYFKCDCLYIERIYFLFRVIYENIFVWNLVECEYINYNIDCFGCMFFGFLLFFYYCVFFYENMIFIEGSWNCMLFVFVFV